MATIPEQASDRRIDPAVLEAFVVDRFRAAEASDEDAALIAGLAVGTDALGDVAPKAGVDPSAIAVADVAT